MDAEKLHVLLQAHSNWPEKCFLKAILLKLSWFILDEVWRLDLDHMSVD